MVNRLLASLLRDRLAAAAIDRVRMSVRRLTGLLAYYAVVAAFGVAGIAFLYVVLYEWLSRSFDRESAAAIICGGNLLIAVLMLILRRAFRGAGRAAEPVRSVALTSPPLEAGIEIGRNLRRRLRKSTPTIVVAAGVLGLAIGLNPGLLKLFGRSPRRAPPAADRKTR